MKGPQKQFDKVHILRTFLILEREKRMGRKELAKKLGLGEGSVRSILKNLEDKGYLKSAVARGHSLSDKGKKFVARAYKFISGPKIINIKRLTIGDKNVAVLIRNCADRIKLGINERDAAIKIGSLGVTTLIFKDNELKFPNQPKFKVKNKELYKMFELKEGDVLIIGTDNNYNGAENAAIAAVLNLVSDKIVF